MLNCTYVYRNKNYSRDRLLRVLSEENPQLSIGSFEESLNWLKDYLGLSRQDAIKVKGLIDGRSLGRFREDGKILLSEFADLKDAKHEAFHRVWRMYLTETERADAIRAFKQDKNWKSKIEYLKPYYPTLTESELIEEHFAREFEDFVISTDSFNTTQPVKSFFQRIVDFIKKLIGLSPVDISVVYQNIYSGKYKGEKAKSVYKGSIDKVIVAGKEVSLEDKNEIITVATQQILSNIIQSPQGLDAFIRSKNTDNLKQSLGISFQNIVRHLNVVNPELAQIVTEDLNQYFIKGGSSYFVNEVKKRIEQLGISVIEIENEEDSAASENDTAVNQRREFTSNIEIDPKTNMSRKVKILLASFKDETRKTPSLGFESPLQWSQAFLKIAEKMAGVPTSDFIEVLLNSNLPFQSQLEDFVKSPSFTFMGNDFISSLSNTINTFSVMQFKDEDIYFFDANVNTKADKVKKEWHNGLVKSINEFDSFDDWVHALKVYNKDARTTVEEISGLLGIEISGESSADINDSIIQLSHQIEAEIRGKGFSNSNIVKRANTAAFTSNRKDMLFSGNNNPGPM